MRITLGVHYLVWWLNLYLIHVSTIQAQCTGNGLLNDCACNFINACKYDASRNIFRTSRGLRKVVQTFVRNVKSFATPTSQVAEICEPGNIGIIYDCKNLIPLAATIVLTARQYGVKHTRPNDDFRRSLQIRDDFQQNDQDYKDALQRVACYETDGKKNLIEQKWYEALTSGKVVSNTKSCPPDIQKSSVHRGHLIAASYGRGTPDRASQTFVYTNAVPQFGTLNSGSWNAFERGLIKWAMNNCMGAPLHVIVGTIPSTYGTNEKRFFGEAGFSEFVGPSNIFPGKSPYRVNVPAFMWTAACCHSASPLFTKSTAFFAPNRPGRGLVRSVKLSELFLEVGVPAAVDLFPGMPSCNDD